MLDALRVLVPLVLAGVATVALDVAARTRGLEPPGFRSELTPSAPKRRVLAQVALAAALFLVVFQPLATLGLEMDTLMPEQVPMWQLFVMHAVLVIGLAGWYLAGFVRLPSVTVAAMTWWSQLGLRARSIGSEVALGIGLGAVSWLTVVLVMVVLRLLLIALGIEEAVPETVSPTILLIAGLPWVVRLAVAVSAGVFEEVFFRGFLQPRIGVIASTVLFVCAHLSYQQPLLLVGITLLSFGFAWMSVWRRSVWAAIAAHATFDAIQLLWFIPFVLRAVESTPAP